MELSDFVTFDRPIRRERTKIRSEKGSIDLSEEREQRFGRKKDLSCFCRDKKEYPSEHFFDFSCYFTKNRRTVGLTGCEISLKPRLEAEAFSYRPTGLKPAGTIREKNNHKNMNDFVSLRCGLFQGSFEAHVTLEKATSCIEDSHKRLGCRTSGSVINGLHIELVKYARKGRLGDVLFMWNFPGMIEVPKEIMRDVGSIQLSCKTVPFNHKVSVFVFGNGKIKLCGKMIDPFLAASAFIGDGECDLTKEHDVVHDAMQAYMDQVKDCACQILGADPLEAGFEPGIIHGQFDFGFHIQGIHELSLFAEKEARDLFSYVRGMEPEIRARAFAIQLYLKDNEKMHLSFDHKGKVQLFNTKGYRDMRKCWHVFMTLIKRALEENIITVSEL